MKKILVKIIGVMIAIILIIQSMPVLALTEHEELEKEKEKIDDQLEDAIKKQEEIEKQKSSTMKSVEELIFKISNAGTIAGSFVLDGKMVKDAIVKVMREGTEIFEGKISTLKRFKDNVKEVGLGFECGIQIEDCDDIKEGDVIEAYIMQRVN